jgi:hypothetical protein
MLFSMRTFQCRCAQPQFFENVHCHSRGAGIGFKPAALDLHDFDAAPELQRCGNYRLAIQSLTAMEARGG